MEINKIYIHIGYPKTATTTLQENILFPLSQANKINYLGILGFSKDKEIHRRYDLLRPLIRGLNQGNISSKPLTVDRVKEEEEFDNSNFTKASFDNVSEFIDSELPNVLSDEAILIPNVNLRGFKSTAVRLKSIFQNNPIKIIITLREQSSLISSFYAEKYPYLYKDKDYNTPQKAFFNGDELKLNSELVDIFNFYEVANTYSEVFGKENISFLFYEKLKEDKNYYLKQFQNILGINDPILQEDESSSKNYRIKAKTKKGEYKIEVERNFPFRRIKRIIKQIPGASSLFNKTLTVPTFNERQIQIIKNHFAESNNCLAKDYSLDEEFMKTHNYLK